MGYRFGPRGLRGRMVLSLVAVPTLVGALAGCGGGAAGGQVADPDPVNVYPNALTVCTDSPYAPFEFKRNGQDVGFDISMAQMVADRLDVRLDVVDVDFDEITSGEALNAGTCDMAVSAITISGERARVVDFSSHYFSAKQVLMVDPASGLKDIKDLSGKRVAVQKGTTGDAYVRDYGPSDVEIVRLADLPAIRSAALSGDVDALVIDNPVVSRTARVTGFEDVQEFDTGENYGIAVKKDGNADLLRVINDVIADAKEDGSYDALYDKWFTA